MLMPGRWLIIVLSLAVAAAALPASGTVAFDASSVATVGTGNLVWTHTPAGTPRGVVVFIVQNSGANQVSSATYGGVTMTEVSGSPFSHTTGEPGTISAYFLGSGVLAGAQTVTVTVTGANSKAAVAYTLTAGADTELEDVDATIVSDEIQNPRATLGLGGVNSWCAIGFHSGAESPGGISPIPGSNWTVTSEHDFGSQQAGFYRYNPVGFTDVTAGWNQLPLDAVAIALAIKEQPQGHVIEDEGTPLTRQTNLNFTGSGVSCADSGGKTVCRVEGDTAVYVSTLAEWNAAWAGGPPPGTKTFTVRIDADIAASGDLPLFVMDLMQNPAAWNGLSIVIDGQDHHMSATGQVTGDNRPVMALGNFGAYRFDSTNVDVTANTIQLEPHQTLPTNTPVFLKSTGFTPATLPAPLQDCTSSTPCYVINTGTRALIQLSSSSGPGGPIDIQSAGSPLPETHELVAVVNASPLNLDVRRIRFVDGGPTGTRALLLDFGYSAVWTRLKDLKLTVLGNPGYYPGDKGLELGDFLGDKLVVQDSLIASLEDHGPISHGLWDLTFSNNTFFGWVTTHDKGPADEPTFPISWKTSGNQFFLTPGLTFSGGCFQSSGDLFQAFGQWTPSAEGWFIVGDPGNSVNPMTCMDVTNALVRADGSEHRYLFRLREFESLRFEGTIQDSAANSGASPSPGNCTTTGGLLATNGALLDVTSADVNSLMASGPIEVDLKIPSDRSGSDAGKPCFPMGTAEPHTPNLMTANAASACSRTALGGKCRGEIKIPPAGQWTIDGNVFVMEPGWFTFEGNGSMSGQDFCDQGHDGAGTVYVEPDSPLTCRKITNAATGADLQNCVTATTDEVWYRVLCN
jgi:hypothetical protein